MKLITRWLVILLAAMAVLGPVSPVAAADELPRVKAEHIILDAGDGWISVVEVLNFSNPGDKAADLQVSLPRGYEGLVFMKGVPEGAAVSEDGFRAAGALPPGDSDVIYGYRVKYDGRETQLRIKTSYDTEMLFVLTNPDALEASAPGLADQGTGEVQGRVFRQFVSPGVAAGAELPLKVKSVAVGSTGRAAPRGETSARPESDLLNRSFHGGNANVRLWMRATGFPGHAGMTGVFIGGVLLLALGIGVSRLVAGMVRGRGEAEGGQEDLGELERERRTLIREIAALDKKHAEGTLDTEVYREAREERKRRLMDILLKLREAGQE